MRKFFSSPFLRSWALLGLIILVIAIPVTVIVVQQRTNTQQHAASSRDCYDAGGTCVLQTTCQGNFPYCSTPNAYTQCSSMNSGNAKYVCASDLPLQGPGGTNPVNPTPTTNDAICSGTVNTFGNGWYCGQKNGAGGDLNYRYNCQSGKVVDSQNCSPFVCQVNNGQADTCSTTVRIPTPTPPTCSNGTETGTCYQNNSCGGTMHEIDSTKSPTCSSLGYRVCCAPGSAAATQVTYHCNTDGKSFSGSDGSQTNCSDIALSDGQKHSNAVCIYAGSITHGSDAPAVGPILCSVPSGGASTPTPPPTTTNICAKAKYNGLYCGKSTQTTDGNPLDPNNPDKLYDCQSRVSQTTGGDGKTYPQQCSNGCTVGGENQEDFCNVAPTATPTPAGTTGNITVHITGIDTANIAFITPVPAQHKTWPFVVIAKDSSGKIVGTFIDSATSLTDTTSALFGTFSNAAFNLGNLATGQYSFTIQTPYGSLPAPITASTISITGNKNNPLTDPNATINTLPNLVMGDINQDGQIDINDYAILLSCYQAATSADCVQNRTTLSSAIHTQWPSISMPSDFLPGDLNDNGVVDGIDYNEWLRGFLQSEGQK